MTPTPTMPHDIRRLEPSLLRRISRLNRTHGLIEAGDRIMVACSGGKDSWALLHLLRAYQAVVPFAFSIVAMNLDQGHPGFSPEVLRAHFERHGFEYRMAYQDTYQVVIARTQPGKIHCSLCSRMRRGILHRVAAELGANKIALGHHRDDVVETLLLNMMYAGQIKAFAPVLAGEDGGAAVIRPLWSCTEADLDAYAEHIDAPRIPCNLCGTQPAARRQKLKQWLAQLERDDPGVLSNLLASIGNVRLQEGVTNGSASRTSDARPHLHVLPEPTF
jgi:tRNA 2-thiocytidine biosynthesis protein TtcA